MESILIYSLVLGFCGLIVWLYLRSMTKTTAKTEEKIAIAKEEGVYEPVSLHPVINPDMCINSGACMIACPEKDILGIRDGRATLISASNCVGHGACFHACPVEAITLVIGTEKRGVDLPHVSQEFETNVPGIYIAGELGGMGLIKNAVEQGQQAVECIVKAGVKKTDGYYDLVIIGAGPAGISASLNAKKHSLNFLTVEQDSLGGTVFTFPRTKLVMTSPMDLPLHGKVKLFNTSKTELLSLWMEVLGKNAITIKELTKIEQVTNDGRGFLLMTNHGEEIKAMRVLLAIGRRGTPRKLGVPGEALEKVAYRLLEPEQITGEKIVVVGGGDSAVESAMLLMNQNEVILSYRQDAFARIKVKNREFIQKAMEQNKLQVWFSSNLTEIEPNHVRIKTSDGSDQRLENDRVYIFAGGELPTQFLEKAGVQVTKRFGFTVRKHR